MSYILEALKKADAERELGAVPHLHAQAAPGLSVAQSTAPPRTAIAVLAGAALAVAGVLGRVALRPVPSVAVLSLPAPTSAPAVPSVPAPPPAAVVVVEAPKPNIAAEPAPKREVPPLSLQDLPPEIKSVLPALAFSGAIHSAQASARMLIVNGQLLHEGDAVAPGLVLLSIGPRSALLRYRETRFTVKY